MPGDQKDNPKPTQKQTEKDTNGTSRPSTGKPEKPSSSGGVAGESRDDMSMIQSFKSDQRK